MFVLFHFVPIIPSCKYFLIEEFLTFYHYFDLRDPLILQDYSLTVIIEQFIHFFSEIIAKIFHFFFHVTYEKNQ